MPPPDRRLVLVSGVPGTGKSTIAVPLAAALRFPLIAKDQIKEALADALTAPSPPALSFPVLTGSGGEFTLAGSRLLGGAAMEVLWALAAAAPAAVLDANFWPGDERQVRRIQALSASPVEVFCQCPADLAARRYAARGATRHRVHAPHGTELSAEAIARAGRPLALGPVITVETAGPADIPALAAAVRTCLS